MDPLMPRRLWLMLHEPRTVTATMGVGWAIVTYLGVAALVMPPVVIVHAVGPAVMAVWAVMLLLGGLVGLAGCLPGWWWVERSGILLAGTGAVTYLMVTVLTPTASVGSRMTQAGFIGLALVLLVTRWIRIRGAQVDPARGLPRVDHH